MNSSETHEVERNPAPAHKPQFLLTALEETVIKATPAAARSLPDNQKLTVKPGTALRATIVRESPNTILVEGPHMADGNPIAGHLRYLHKPHWAISRPDGVSAVGPKLPLPGGHANLLKLWAKNGTFIKSRDAGSKELADHEKIAIRTNSTIFVSNPTFYGNTIKVEFARSGAQTFPPDFVFLQQEHWNTPAGFDKHSYFSAKDHPDSIVVEWMPREKLLYRNLVHYRPGNSTLVVTFDPMGQHAKYLAPWGGKFITEKGWSLLGVTSRKNTWFRSPDLRDYMASLAEKGFFAQFERVVFIGSSMGGFGAGVFSELSPGATVVLIAPQSTLDPRLVPWEHRFHEGRYQNWEGRFTDAAESTKSASRLVIVHDPRHKNDSNHAARFQHENLLVLNARHFGHPILGGVLEMGALKPFMEAAITGKLDRESFAAIMRHRRRSPSFLRSLISTASYRKNSRFSAVIKKAMQGDEASASSPA